VAVIIGKIISKHASLEEISKFFEGFVASNVFGQQSQPALAYLNLRHVVSMIKELSKAKENAFKHAQWPFELLKAPLTEVRFRTKALKVCKQVLEFLDLPLLLTLAEVINAYFREIQSVIAQLDTKVLLKYLRALCSVGFKLNNLVPLDTKNFQLFCSYIENYYLLGFESPLNEKLT